MTGRLPVTLPPLPGELLSSWISRHADFYGVTPLTMLRHGLPEATSLGPIDLSLTKAQANQIAVMFGACPKLVRSLSFADAPKAAHRFISKGPMQRCARCTDSGADSLPVLRSELQGWRITCPHCGEPYQDKTTSDGDRTLAPYRAAARRGAAPRGGDRAATARPRPRRARPRRCGPAPGAGRAGTGTRGCRRAARRSAARSSAG